jgi:hypothetical protein
MNYTMQDHLDDNAEEIAAEAAIYAMTYGVSMEVALRDVKDLYREGYCDSVAASRTTDWDYGQE